MAMKRSKRTTEGQLDLFTLSDFALTTIAVAVQTFVGFSYNAADALTMGLSKTRLAINALRALKVSSPPTIEQKLDLVRFPGWGAIGKLIGNASGIPYYSPQRKEVDELTKELSPAQRESANAASLTSYFTPPAVVDAIWTAARHYGFTGGKVLEPSAGSGAFIGLCPTDLRSRSSFVAVERDASSAAILKALYGDTEEIIESALEDTRLPESYFDLVIGNVPFGQTTIRDKQTKGMTALVHDYFILKALRKVRPGGLVMLLTTAGTMDKLTSRAREQMARCAELMTAVRLPTSVFADDGASVVVDLLVFRRFRNERGVFDKPTWTGNTVIAFEAVNFPINPYWLDNPRHVLGDLESVSSKFGNKLSCVGDLNIEAMCSILCAGELQRHLSDEPEVDTRAMANPGMPEGSFQLVNGRVHVVENGLLSVFDKTGAALKRVLALIAVRDTLKQLLVLQVSAVATELEVEQQRAKLRASYDQLCGEVQQITSRGNRIAFDDDPSYPLLLSLEAWDENEEVYVPAKILSARTTWPMNTARAATTVVDAALISLDTKGKIDVAYVASLIGRDEETVRAEIASADGYFINPQTVAPETADQYLSGNIREKLGIAEDAAARNTSYLRNVVALKAVLPAWVPAEQIGVRLGQPWIPPDDICEFTKHLTKQDYCRISYAASTATWQVPASRHSPVLWQTDQMDFWSLLRHALNQQQPRITRMVDGKEVVDSDATLAAQAKMLEIQEAFGPWLWSDVDRTTRLESVYNELFNCMRKRVFDGSHLTFAGMSGVYKPRSNQYNAIWRGLQTGSLLLDHFVGSGKTLTLCALAMESRRLGRARKPIIVVANSTLPQFTGEFLRIYPGANVLMMGREDMSKSERKRFVARVATGDWDAVIMPHSVFDRLALSKEMIDGYAQELCDPIDLELASDSLDRNVERKLQQTRESLVEKLDRMIDASTKDDHILFSELGCDMVLIDEAHAYKNLFVQSKMQSVAGVSTNESQRAMGMLLKTRYISELRGGQSGVVFATATPLTNTMTEVFVLQQYLQPVTLQKFGIGHFDAWAANFGNVVTEVEVAPDGSGFRTKARFARFINVPELATICSEFWDTVTPEDVQGLIRPELETGQPIIISVPASPVQRAYTAMLSNRADDVRKRIVSPKEDNMLAIVLDGAKAALDMRIIDPTIEDHADSKVNACIRNVFEIWAKSSDLKATQIVFCDLSVGNQPGFSVYEDIAHKLINRGIPREQIAFAQNFKTDAKLMSLDRDMNAGKIRVLLGSSSVLGIGRNVQKRLLAWHHLDVPYRADQVEQRDGRGMRHGNTHKVVANYRYVTEGSFDAYKWQTVHRKAMFTAQFRKADVAERTVEDLDAGVMSYAEIKAIASGDARVRDHILMQNKMGMLNAQYRDKQRMVAQLEHEVRMLPTVIESAERGLVSWTAAASAAVDVSRTDFTVTLDGQVYTNRSAAAGVLLKFLADFSASKALASRQIGSFAGYQLELSKAGSNMQLVYGECRLGCNASAMTEPESLIRRLSELPKMFATRQQESAARLRHLIARLPTAQEAVSTLKADFAQFKAEFEKYEEKASLLAKAVEAVTE